jgi:hypothetical protein
MEGKARRNRRGWVGLTEGQGRKGEKKPKDWGWINGRTRKEARQDAEGVGLG